MDDPTYEVNKIQSNPIWSLAFKLSEQYNDNAPIGWSNYIKDAKKMMEK